MQLFYTFVVALFIPNIFTACKRSVMYNVYAYVIYVDAMW